MVILVSIKVQWVNYLNNKHIKGNISFLLRYSGTII